jgi:SAM-dependent methyltransferase
MESGINIACPACASCDTRQAFVKDGYLHYSCKSCSSLFVWPRPAPEEIADYYKSESKTISSALCWDKGMESHGHLLHVWRSLLASAESLCGEGPLLDIGCGTGSFLSLAKSLGWGDLVGVEIVPEAAEIAMKLKDAKIYNEDFSIAKFPEQHFAVITLFDFIEHVIDAKGLLERVFNLLKPGGAVIIGTVNRQGISMHMLGQRAFTICPPEHLTIFSEGGVLQLLKHTGFQVKSRRSASIYLREWLRFLMPAS